MIYYFINHLAIHPLPKGMGLLAKRIKIAEEVGFEPTERFFTRSLDFKSSTLNRSDTPLFIYWQ